MADFTPAIGQEVFLSDGRKAAFAGMIDGQIFVRVMLYRDDEQGYEEWPSDKLTPVDKVFASEPMEAYGQQICAVKEQIEQLKADKATIANTVATAKAEAVALTEASKKYPAIQTAIDFFEGRITHVVVGGAYTTPKVQTLAKVLTSSDDRREDGLKLLCLFGCDTKGQTKWGYNTYRDGSGSWTYITPFASEESAWQHVRDRMEAEVGLWRNGEKRHNARQYTDAFARDDWPTDWRLHIEGVEREAIAKRVAEYEAKIAAELARLPAIAKALGQ